MTQPTPKTSVLRRMAKIAAGFRDRTLPDAVLAHATATLQDTVSIMAGGFHVSEAAQITTKLALKRPGAAGIVGGGRVAPEWASFANAVSAHASDYEDGHSVGGNMHPASPIIPAMIAAAGPETTVREALVAQIAGYEIALRFGRALMLYGQSPWFHGSGTAGAVGAAVSAAVVAGGSADAVARAAHIACTHAPFANGAWPMIKESSGWGAISGYVAWELAEAGFMTAPDGYDERNITINYDSPFDLPGAMDDAFIASMGTVFEAENTYFKPYATCRWLHSAIFAFSELVTRNAIRPDEIEAVTVETHEGAAAFSDPKPKTIEHGQYSHEMALSAVALDGAAGHRQMSVEAMSRPERIALAAKVRMVHAPEFDPLLPAQVPARVTVETKARGRFELVEYFGFGAPENPLSEADLEAKWIDLLTTQMVEPTARTLLAGLADPDARLLEVLAPVFAEPSGSAQ